MIAATDISKHVDAQEFLVTATKALHSQSVESLLAKLAIVSENDYVFRPEDHAAGWREGFLHWFPVGAERGNAGRIKLAGSPENPIAERTVNAFEAMIEMTAAWIRAAQPVWNKPTHFEVRDGKY